MPSFVSKNGKWSAAKEKVAIKDENGEDTIYEGPDRAAKEFLEQNGGEVGQDALLDPQNLQAARNMGFNTVDEMFKAMSPTAKEAEAIELAQNTVITHKDPRPKPGVGDTLGGFNDNKTTPLEAMEAKKRGRPRNS